MTPGKVGFVTLLVWDLELEAEGEERRCTRKVEVGVEKAGGEVDVEDGFDGKGGCEYSTVR